jgi:hypothetical protein
VCSDLAVTCCSKAFTIEMKFKQHRWFPFSFVTHKTMLLAMSLLSWIAPEMFRASLFLAVSYQWFCILADRNLCLSITVVITAVAPYELQRVVSVTFVASLSGTSTTVQSMHLSTPSNCWWLVQYTWSDNKVRELTTVCLPWQQWTETSVWFDDGASAFHSYVVVDLWQSLSEWHLLLSECVFMCHCENIRASC